MESTALVVTPLSLLRRKEFDCRPPRVTLDLAESGEASVRMPKHPARGLTRAIGVASGTLPTDGPRDQGFAGLGAICHMAGRLRVGLPSGSGSAEGMERAMRIVIREGRGPQPYYFTIESDNYRKLATSEMYLRKSDARDAAELVKSQAGAASIVEATASASRW